MPTLNGVSAASLVSEPAQLSLIETEWDNYRVDIEDYVAQGDKVFAFGTYSGTYVKTGKHFSARVAHLWKIHSGKIVSFEQFVDSHTVVNAM